VNVEGTRALLDAAKAAGVARFVYGSTIGVYGDRQGLISEATPPQPDNIYGTTKLEAERLVLGRADGQPVTAIRISETYGPGDRRLLKLFKAIKKGRFFSIGDGRNLHHPVYIDDLADGILAAARHDAARGEVFVLPGKEAVSTDAMVAAVAAAVGKPMPKLRVPLAPLMAAAAVLEGTLRPLGIQPPLHRRRMDFFKKSFEFDPTKARQRLGWAPSVGFAEGAERTARWYESIGEL
jgi:nucleoside-diphosphate-sugar epimerase